jgi:hypothetical protein
MIFKTEMAMPLLCSWQNNTLHQASKLQQQSCMQHPERGAPTDIGYAHACVYAYTAEEATHWQVQPTPNE